MQQLYALPDIHAATLNGWLSGCNSRHAPACRHPDDAALTHTYSNTATQSGCDVLPSPCLGQGPVADWPLSSSAPSTWGWRGMQPTLHPPGSQPPLGTAHARAQDASAAPQAVLLRSDPGPALIGSSPWSPLPLCLPGMSGGTAAAAAAGAHANKQQPPLLLGFPMDIAGPSGRGSSDGGAEGLLVGGAAAAAAAVAVAAQVSRPLQSPFAAGPGPLLAPPVSQARLREPPIALVSQGWWGGG